MSNLRKITLKGLAWRGSSSTFQFVLQLVLSLVLMRFIGPNDFGLIAKIFIVMTLFNIFLDFGFSQAIIQEKSTSHDYLSSHFFISLFIGVFLGILLALLSPWIAYFYETPELEFPFYIFSILLVVGSTYIVHRALFHKAMQFRQLAIINFCTMIISAIVALYLAMNGYGYWAIVFQHISSILIQAVLFWFLSDFRPKMVFQWKHFSQSGSFSIYVFITDFFKYAVDMLDQFMVSIFYNQTILGYYNRSIALIKRPARVIPDTFASILFPLFSQYSDTSQNAIKIHDIYYKTTGIIIYLITPFLVLYYFFAHEIIDAVLGSEWYGIIEYTKIIALIQIVAIQNLEGPLYLSKGKSKQLMYIIVFSKIILILAILIGIQFDLAGLLWAILVAEILVRISKILYVQKLFAVDVKRYAEFVFSSLLIAAVFSGIVFFITYSLSLNSLGILLTLGVLITLLHMILIWYFPFGSPKIIKSLVFPSTDKSST